MAGSRATRARRGWARWLARPPCGGYLLWIIAKTARSESPTDPPRVDDDREPAREPTGCTFCGKPIEEACVRDLRVEVLTRKGGIAGEIALRGHYFCPPERDPATGAEFVVCATQTAKAIVAECNKPRDPERPVFGEINRKHWGQITKYRIGYAIVGPAPEGSGSGSGPGDIHGAGYQRVTTPGFADQVVDHPR